MIAVKVQGLILDSQQNPLLLLVDLEETIVLPISIGFWEGQAIALKLRGHVLPRPITYDLIKSLCSQLGTVVKKVVVTDIKENTFYAEIRLETGKEKKLVVDARPSDAVGLALTVGCPIYITSKVAACTVSLKSLMNKGDFDKGGSKLH